MSAPPAGIDGVSVRIRGVFAIRSVSPTQIGGEPVGSSSPETPRSEARSPGVRGKRTALAREPSANVSLSAVGSCAVSPAGRSGYTLSTRSCLGSEQRELPAKCAAQSRTWLNPSRHGPLPSLV